MSNHLHAIIKQKQQEVAQLKQRLSVTYQDPNSHRISLLRDRPNAKSFQAALQVADQMAIISEVKRRSPSKGSLANFTDPIQLVERYLEGGTHAISVLTDPTFFSGSLTDLSTVAAQLQCHPTPILRKDFILDPLQIVESILYGADAVLLIVSVLQDETIKLVDFAKQLAIDTIVEVHNREELAIALKSGTEIIGINNRDLTTFKVDLETSIKLAPHIPDHYLTISESGISHPDEIKRLRDVGFNGVLVGEALVKHAQPALCIQQLRRAS